MNSKTSLNKMARFENNTPPGRIARNRRFKPENGFVPLSLAETEEKYGWVEELIIRHPLPYLEIMKSFHWVTRLTLNTYKTVDVSSLNLTHLTLEHVEECFVDMERLKYINICGKWGGLVVINAGATLLLPEEVKIGAGREINQALNFTRVKYLTIGNGNTDWPYFTSGDQVPNLLYMRIKGEYPIVPDMPVKTLEMSCNRAYEDEEFDYSVRVPALPYLEELILDSHVWVGIDEAPKVIRVVGDGEEVFVCPRHPTAWSYLTSTHIFGDELYSETTGVARGNVSIRLNERDLLVRSLLSSENAAAPSGDAPAAHAKDESASGDLSSTGQISSESSPDIYQVCFTIEDPTVILGRLTLEEARLLENIAGAIEEYGIFDDVGALSQELTIPLYDLFIAGGGRQELVLILSWMPSYHRYLQMRHPDRPLHLPHEILRHVRLGTATACERLIKASEYLGIRDLLPLLRAEHRYMLDNNRSQR